MHNSKPVFVVGSPRSGTSVLTWALGQHPNLLLTEESNWLGSFALHAAAAHAQGSARVLRSQLSSLGITRGSFLSGLGDAIDRMILAGRDHLETVGQVVALHSPRQVAPEFAISRSPAEAKTRWVDGTPENSLQIHALLALFPQARFVHILRDVDEVVASLLAFRDERGHPLVDTTEAAFAYWMRTTQACVDAESALGPDVIHRVRYADLVTDGEHTLRGILGFLGEPFAPACLGPLKHRINSSSVGAAVPHAHRNVRYEASEQARRSSAEWLRLPQPACVDAAALGCWQAEFETSVSYVQGLEGNWETAQRMLKQTRLALAGCGALLLLNWLFALALLLRSGEVTAVLWLLLASASVVVYGWLRRNGLRAIAARILSVVVRPMMRRQ